MKSSPDFRSSEVWPVLTPGRPIQHLALGEMKAHRHLPGLQIGSILPNFGSSASLESRTINHLDCDLKEYLAEIFPKCPLIHELTVTTHTGNEWGIDAVSPWYCDLCYMKAYITSRRVSSPNTFSYYLNS